MFGNPISKTLYNIILLYTTYLIQPLTFLQTSQHCSLHHFILFFLFLLDRWSDIGIIFSYPISGRLSRQSLAHETHYEMCLSQSETTQKLPHKTANHQHLAFSQSRETDGRDREEREREREEREERWEERGERERERKRERGREERERERRERERERERRREKEGPGHPWCPFWEPDHFHGSIEHSEIQLHGTKSDLLELDLRKHSMSARLNRPHSSLIQRKETTPALRKDNRHWTLLISNTYRKSVKETNKSLNKEIEMAKQY